MRKITKSEFAAILLAQYEDLMKQTPRRTTRLCVQKRYIIQVYEHFIGPFPQA